MSDKPIVVDGIKVDISRDDIDDIELLEQMEEGNVPAAFRTLFGEKKYTEIKEKLRNEETGKTKVSDLMEWFQHVTERLNAGN